MSEFSVRHFLDIEAIVAREDEEELDEGEDDPGELLDDEEEVLDDETETISRASANVEAQDLEDEAVRIVARAGHNTRSSYKTIDDIPLPF
ncbi:hypothetical protein EDB84DRAFT_1558155 [Lactarius hengduanensis]|nr:hypothetical protein EDB84DRAFT_1558155 [Lactarius hengduanensis]